MPGRESVQQRELLESVLDLTAVHREHEKYYSSAPREVAVTLQRHAHTLQALADRWSTAEPSTRPVLSPFEGAEDLNAPAAVQLDGVLFLEGTGRPPEVTHLLRDLRTAADDATDAGAWLAAAMQVSWDMAESLVAVDGLADVLGERHRIIANDWRAADTTALAGRLLRRAADLVDRVDMTPAALRVDLAGPRTAAARLHSAAEVVGHAADLLSDAAGYEHDSERRWRVFRAAVEDVLAGRLPSGR